MKHEDIIRMAREAGFHCYNGCADGIDADLERFFQAAYAAGAAAEREKVAAWMIHRGYATGHGDTTEDLLKELDWQIDERIAAERAEVERLKLLCEEMLRELYVYRASEYLKDVTASIRARIKK